MSEEQVGMSRDPLSCDVRDTKETSEWRDAAKVAMKQK